MAAPHISAKAQEDHSLRPFRRNLNYGLPKNHCKNRSEWRILPGKPPEPLSPYYHLGCEFGSSLMLCHRDEGSEPVYVCQEHAKELGHATDVRASAGELSKEAGKNGAEATSAEPIATLMEKASGGSETANSGSSE